MISEKLTTKKDERFGRNKSLTLFNDYVPFMDTPQNSWYATTFTNHQRKSKKRSRNSFWIKDELTFLLQCWPTSKDFHPPFWGHWMQSGLTKNDDTICKEMDCEREKEKERERKKKREKEKEREKGRERKGERKRKGDKEGEREKKREK